MSDHVIQEPAPITAIVTAYRRVQQTVATLGRVKQCVPPPAEIIVHVDGNQVGCADTVRSSHPDVRVAASERSLGPGGGRNKLVEAASFPIVASFDDDSYPIDDDYFARVLSVFRRFPDAAVVTGRVYHVDEEIGEDGASAEWVSDFSGCACAYRRDAFLETGGYVPLPVAYGMEEVDFALRLHSGGGRVLQTSWLRVFHDTDRARHADPRVTAASIANLALLTYLRYPVSLWPVGLLQCLNRIAWLLRAGRWRGIAAGMASTPSTLWRYRSYSGRLSATTVRSYLRLRRAPKTAAWFTDDASGTATS